MCTSGFVYQYSVQNKYCYVGSAEYRFDGFMVHSNLTYGPVELYFYIVYNISKTDLHCFSPRCEIDQSGTTNNDAVACVEPYTDVERPYRS